MTQHPHVPVRRRFFLLGSAALLLSGCAGGLIGPPPAPELYVLHSDMTADADAPAAAWQLVISVPEAPESLDTSRIALINAPNTMDYFAKSQWTDRVTLLLQSLLVEAFQRSGKIKAVGRDTAGLNPDYLLNLDVLDFEAFYAVPDTPPRIDVKVAATLMGARNHEVVQTMRSEHSVQASANDMTSITQAFTEATGAALREIVNWTLHAPAPQKAVTDIDEILSPASRQRPPNRHGR
jgi:cholesterol transport system auxiliary component